MAIDPLDLVSIDADSYESARDLVNGLLAVELPNADLTVGTAIAELLVRPASLLYAYEQTRYDRLLSSGSLESLIADPTLSSDVLVDRVLSNYGIARRGSSVGGGKVTIILDRLSLPVIPSSMTFTTSSGVVFRPIQVFTGVASNSDIVTTSDRIVVIRPDLKYAMTIDVVATNVGSSGNIPAGVVLTPSSQIDALSSVISASDFSGGTDSESTETLVGRLASGITTPALTSRVGAVSLVKSAFPNVTDASVIGAFDPEMFRATTNPLSVKTAGRCDVYVRTGPSPVRETLIKSARLTDVATGTWSMTFTRDEFPGLYEISSILPRSGGTTGSLNIVSDVRGFDSAAVAGTDGVPALTGLSAEYTRYQTVIILFIDTAIPSTALIGLQRDYLITVVRPDGIERVNDFVRGRDRLPPGGDYVVRASHPCFVSVGVTVEVGAGEASPSVVAIQSAISDAVNSTDFSIGRLDVSAIIAAAGSVLSRRTRISGPVAMTGTLRLPGGRRIALAGPTTLEAPTMPELGCSSRTMSFFCAPNDVFVQITPSRSAPV